MRFLTLYSGSGGNCTYIEASGAKILIDAGKSARTLCSALLNVGTNIDEIDAIFITHEHTDHISALEVLTKKHKIPVHMACECAKKFVSPIFSTLNSCIVPHSPFFEENIKGVHISSFPTPHDSRMSVGYRIDFLENDIPHSFGLATDIGYVTDSIKNALVGCEAVVLESNHDIDMLRNGPYPYDLKKRIMSKRGHLSNSDSSLFASFLVQNGTKSFILAHLSEENNAPQIALDEFLSSVANPEISVSVASPTLPTEMIFN